jgi:UDP-glucuronate decarboxylase
LLGNDGRVVSNFIVQALKNNPLTVYGNGSQTRSFCYVSDLVEGFIRLMSSDYIYPVNIGNPNEYTVMELAAAVKNIINPGLEIIYKPLPSDDPHRRRPDISKAKSLLDWEPKIQLSEGLKLTVDYFQEKLK